MIQDAIVKENWFSREEYARRVELVRGEMARRGLDALLVFSPANVYYLTGHHSIDTWEYRAVVVSHDRDPMLLLYGFERGRFLASSWLEESVFYAQQDDPVECLAAVINEMGLSKATLGVESNSGALSLTAYRRMEECLKNARLVEAACLVDRVRMIKSIEEMDCIHRAAELTRIGLRAGMRSIHEGAIDHQLAAVITEAMFYAGSHQLVMQPTVAIGYRSGLSHSQHDGVSAQRSDSVFLELSGCYRHYSAPVMYTTTIGDIDNERKELLDVAQNTANVIIEHARPGVRACDVAAKALESIRPIENRIQFHYVFGYSVGVSFPPHWIEESGLRLQVNNDEVLQPGMVFHLPLVMRVLGKYAAGTSRTIEITPTGAVALTGDPGVPI